MSIKNKFKNGEVLTEENMLSLVEVAEDKNYSSLIGAPAVPDIVITVLRIAATGEIFLEIKGDYSKTGLLAVNNKVLKKGYYMEHSKTTSFNISDTELKGEDAVTSTPTWGLNIALGDQGNGKFLNLVVPNPLYLKNLKATADTTATQVTELSTMVSDANSKIEALQKKVTALEEAQPKE